MAADESEYGGRGKERARINEEYAEEVKELSYWIGFNKIILFESPFNGVYQKLQSIQSPFLCLVLANASRTFLMKNRLLLEKKIH